jgi:hydroxyethylthiazole kinase-like uncharacterized protein yjeF
VTPPVTTRLVGSAEMRAIDRAASARHGVPSLELMERAGRAVAQEAEALAAPPGRVVILTGAGNNGGDGWVAARLLQREGRKVRVVALAEPDGLAGDAAIMAERAR